MRFSYLRPDQSDDFEDFCVRLYAHQLKRSGMVRFGKRGQKQSGIDIIDQHGTKPAYVIQCKHKEPNKKLSEKEIRTEVGMAEKSGLAIDHYIIATTAQKSREAQEVVLRLNQRPESARPFVVAIHFWEEMTTYLNELDRAIADFIFYGRRSEEDANVFSNADIVMSNAVVQSVEAGPYSGIDELISAKRFEVAAYELDKLPNPEIDQALTKEQKYALLRLKAKLALEQADPKEASRLFRAAFETSPELAQAQQNNVLALLLENDLDAAFSEARKLVKAGNDSPTVINHLIRSAPSAKALRPFKRVIAKHAKVDEDVNNALTLRYLDWEMLPQAEIAAQNALGISPRSAHALFFAGMVEHHTAIVGNWQGRQQRLSKAVDLYSESIAEATSGRTIGLLPEIHTNLGNVFALLGALDKASLQFRSAIASAKKSAAYASSAISFFLNKEDYESANELLPKLDTSADESVFLKAVTKYHVDGESERRLHLLEMYTLVDRKFRRAMEARFFCVKWAIQLKDFAFARKCVTSELTAQSPFHAHTLTAWIEYEAGYKEQAALAADLALDSSSREAHTQEVALLATVLVNLGKEEEALPLLERAAPRGILDTDTRRLIECARQLERHDVLLRVCSELREANKQDNTVRRIEVQTLAQYDPDAALELAKEFQQFDPSYFTAMRSFLAVKARKLEEVEIDDEAPPDASDFSPEQAYLVAIPYIATSRYKQARHFLYQQLRAHFSSEMAHGQYIDFCLRYGDKLDDKTLESVNAECTVCLENQVTGTKRWVTIEEVKPNPAFHEHSPASVHPLMGKTVGDVVTLIESAVQAQPERIVEIQSKYLRACQEAISRFKERFRESNAFQSLHVGNEEDFDPTPLVESLRQRRESIDYATRFYKENLCPIHLFATRIGSSDREALMYLTSNDHTFVRCANYNADLLSQIPRTLLKRRVVLDISAILTIDRLGIWAGLGENRVFLVSRATLETIRRWLDAAADKFGRPAGYGTLSESGQLCFQELTALHHQYERIALENLLHSVEATCSTQSSMSPAALAPQRRETYARTLGFHTLEAISVAKDQNATLWTDDYVVGGLAEREFGISRVWTQLACRVLHEEGSIEAAAFSDISAKLVGWHYVATTVTANEFISAGRLSEWDVKTSPLKELVSVLAEGTQLSWFSGKWNFLSLD